MAKKATIEQNPTTNPAEAGETTGENKSLRLTAMQLSCLSYYSAVQYEKTEQAELEASATFPTAVTAPLVAAELLEVTESGFKVTPYGVKWVLKSTTFGINFKKLFSPEVTPHTSTLHAALAELAPELARRHENSPIFYKKKGSNDVSPFWNQFYEWVGMIDRCLEEPE